MLQGARAGDHVTQHQRTDLRDRAAPRSGRQYSAADVVGDVTGQYRERYFPPAEAAMSRDVYRGSVTGRYGDATPDPQQPGLRTPPWNKIPSQSLITRSTLITFAKEVMFLPEFVCLSVSQQDNTKSYGRIFLKFSGNVGNGKSYQCFNFGDDPKGILDSGSL